MKVLFLDFDGVLHPVGGTSEGRAFVHLARLQAFLREPAMQDVAVVVSSTWRLILEPARLIGLFAPDIRARVRGATPDLGDEPMEHARYREIRAWLDRHPEVKSWAALDDAVRQFPPHAHRHVVFTSPATGLTDADLAALGQVLRHQPKGSET